MWSTDNRNAYGTYGEIDVFLLTGDGDALLPPPEARVAISVLLPESFSPRLNVKASLS